MNCESALKELMIRLIVAEMKRFELDSTLYTLGIELNNELFDFYHEILRDIVDADAWGEHLSPYIQGEVTVEEIAESICNVSESVINSKMIWLVL
jgi:hypothetical protein